MPSIRARMDFVQRPAELALRVLLEDDVETATRTNFVVGMRVVIKASDLWDEPRVAGHYGKIVEIIESVLEFIKVDITGHIDGRPPQMELFDDMKYFFAEELEVVD